MMEYTIFFMLILSTFIGTYTYCELTQDVQGPELFEMVLETKQHPV